jgi:hypothetical protein
MFGERNAEADKTRINMSRRRRKTRKENTLKYMQYLEYLTKHISVLPDGIL